jgi:dihydroorotate dehydrogenase (fumarate)/dihydropyrimidine dehydrogenase (NAD+) subunit PreA
LSKVDLSVDFCGFKMKNPIIAASATPTHDPIACKKAADAGAGGVILKTLFAKEAAPSYNYARPRFKLLNWHPSGKGKTAKYPDSFTLYSIEQSTVFSYDKFEWYINKTKELVGENVAVIASIMGGVERGWEEQCEIIQGSKADICELNFSCPHAAEVEEHIGTAVGSVPEAAERITKLVRKKLDIPIIPKMTPQAGNIAAIAKMCERAGADAVTIHNRLMGLMIDIDKARPIEWGCYSGFGGPFMLPLSLRWIAKTREAGVKIPISASNGYWNWQDPIMAIMVGADTVQTCTAVMVKGFEEITNWLREIEKWMEGKGYKNFKELKGIALKNIIPGDEIEREVPIMVGGTSSKIAVVDTDKCSLCEWCQKVCFHEAMSMDDYPTVDEEKCEACGLCASVCPEGAITIQKK